MANVLFTLAEDPPKSREDHFAVRYHVDDNDCYDFADGLKRLGHTVYFVNWNDLHDGAFARAFCYNERAFVEKPEALTFDLVFVYKMEGFLFDLPRFYAMVSHFEHTCACVVNHPRTIRHNIDKRYMWELQGKGIAIPETHLIDDTVVSKLSSGRKMVLKPMRAERGIGALLASDLSALSSIVGRESEYIAQDYLPEIRNGERSLVFLGLEYQHAVLKRSSAQNLEEFRCNESHGGTQQVYEPTAQEHEFATDVLRAYQSLGYEVHFSRVDFVVGEKGPCLIEAELLNPSIYANLSGKGEVFGEKIAEYFDRLIARRSGTRTHDSATSFSA